MYIRLGRELLCGNPSPASMMMKNSALSVLLLLFCSLCGAQGLGKRGDFQETRALQQGSEAKEASVREM